MGENASTILISMLPADPPSIYKEIGPGERIALAKLAIDKFEETGRPLRIAIDVSIWLFQIQAAQGKPHLSRCFVPRARTDVVIDRWHQPSIAHLLLSPP